MPRLRMIHAAVLALSVMPTPGRAQQLPGLDDPYVKAVSEVLDEWTAGQLLFTKDRAAAQFSVGLEKFSSLSPTGTIERYLPPDLIKARFDNLPQTLNSELPLSGGAKLMMLGAVLDKTDRLSQSIKPEPAEIADALHASFYLILGSAQLEAVESKKLAIDASSIQRGAVWFFSLGWPFCCAEDGP